MSFTDTSDVSIAPRNARPYYGPVFFKLLGDEQYLRRIVAFTCRFAYILFLDTGCNDYDVSGGDYGLK